MSVLSGFSLPSYTFGPAAEVTYLRADRMQGCGELLLECSLEGEVLHSAPTFQKGIAIAHHILSKQATSEESSTYRLLQKN